MNISDDDILRMPVHPFANLLPAMSDDELEKLVADVDQNGVHMPLLHDGQYLYDGRHRRQAILTLREQGRNPVFRHDRLPELTPVEQVLLINSLNVHRRHLNASQQAIVALEIKKMIQQELRPGRPAAGTAPRGTARDIAAALVGSTSGRAVDMAAKLEAADPVLFEAVRAGNITLNHAAKQVLERQEEQQYKDEPPAPERIEWQVCFIGRLPGRAAEFLIREDRTDGTPLYHLSRGEIINRTQRVCTEGSPAAAKNKAEKLVEST